MGQRGQREVGQFLKTLGVVPEPIKVMREFAPAVLEAYVTMRREIMAEGDGHLPMKVKELIFVILDVSAGNLPGAKNHMRAALRAGLTIPELTEALIQVMMVHGIATWGMTGYKVLRYAASLTSNGRVVQTRDPHARARRIRLPVRPGKVRP